MPAVNSQRGDTNVLFDEFVREALVILFAVTLAMVWAWTALVALFDAERTVLFRSVGNYSRWTVKFAVSPPDLAF